MNNGHNKYISIRSYKTMVQAFNNYDFKIDNLYKHKIRNNIVFFL